MTENNIMTELIYFFRSFQNKFGQWPKNVPTHCWSNVLLLSAVYEQKDSIRFDLWVADDTRINIFCL